MRFGMIGAGIISESHLRVFEQIEGADAVSIADINKDKAEGLAEKYGLSAYTDFREMIAEESLDAVIIALPHFLHEEAGIFCMENGCHVLMEKPMAISSAACDRLIEAAERHQRTFFVGHIRYYFEEDRLIGKMLQDRKLGNISMINIKRYADYFYDGRPSWFLNPAMSGGGILANIGTHEIEKIIRYGGNIKHVKAFAVKREGTEVEGIVNAVLELENGIIASIKMNGYSAYTFNDLEIVCEKGIIRTISGKGCIEILSGNGEEQIKLTDSTNPFALQLKDFITCVENSVRPYLSGKYGRKVIDAVERIYLSAGIRYFD